MALSSLWMRARPVCTSYSVMGSGSDSAAVRGAADPEPAPLVLPQPAGQRRHVGQRQRHAPGVGQLLGELERQLRLGLRQLQRPASSAVWTPGGDSASAAGAKAPSRCTTETLASALRASRRSPRRRWYSAHTQAAATWAEGCNSSSGQSRSHFTMVVTWARSPSCAASRPSRVWASRRSALSTARRGSNARSCSASGAGRRVDGAPRPPAVARPCWVAQHWPAPAAANRAGRQDQRRPAADATEGAMAVHKRAGREESINAGPCGPTNWAAQPTRAGRQLRPAQGW